MLFRSDPHTIGIVDMFGVEAKSVNPLENLLINVLSEQMQYYYNQFMYQWEMVKTKFRIQILSNCQVKIIFLSVFLIMIILMMLHSYQCSAHWQIPL